jgi:hypothetical protein
MLESNVIGRIAMVALTGGDTGYNALSRSTFADDRCELRPL